MYLYSNEYNLGLCSILASATILVYDYCLTFDDEVQFMWPQPWAFGTFLFIVNRYLPFFDTMLALKVQLSVVSIEACHGYFNAISWIVANGLMVSELVILMRTYAMWQRRRKILYFLGGMSALTFGPGIAITILELNSLRFEEAPAGGLGCHLVFSSRLIAITYLLLALSETVVVVLTLLRGRKHVAGSNSTWVKHIYKHGIMFYAYLLMITIVNIVVPFATSGPSYKHYLALPQHVFHSVFCNRVILLISRRRSFVRDARDRSLEMDHRDSYATKTNLPLPAHLLSTHNGQDSDLERDLMSAAGRARPALSTIHSAKETFTDVEIDLDDLNPRRSGRSSCDRDWTQ